MKRVLIASVLLLGTALGARADNIVWNDVRHPERPNSEIQFDVKRDAAACDREVGTDWVYPSVAYQQCMRRHDWTLQSVKPDPQPRRAAERTVTFNRDSPDPRIGWHWVNGFRTCTQDCENPEAPGSGYTCTYHADGWRECVK